MISNITNWLDHTVDRFPNKTAFVDKEKEITFLQLQEQSSSLATVLIKKKISKRPIVIYLEKGVDVITSFLGVAYSGNFYCPVDVNMPINRIEKIIETLQPEAIITTEALLSNIQKLNYNKECIVFDNEILKASDRKLVNEVRSKIIDTDLLYVLFTSGSTGTPKGVSISHRSVMDYIDWVVSKFQFSEKTTLANQAPFYFDNSVFDIYCTINTGATMYILAKDLFTQPLLLGEYLKEKEINTLFWVPSALIILSKLKVFRSVDLSKTLKNVIFAGEIMPNKQLNIWRKFLPNAVYANLYGPTEVTVDCTYYIVDRNFSDDEPLPIGRPMPNTDVIVLNEKNQLVQNNEIGELYVRGTSLAQGYYNNFEKTSESFIQNPLHSLFPDVTYRTGDLVKYNELGELVFVCRKDFQIKHLGHRIELGEIEVAVLSLDKINICSCLYDDEKKKIVLFVEDEIKKQDVINGIIDLIPDYMYPQKVIKLDQIPMNENGKIDRVKLKEYLTRH